MRLPLLLFCFAAPLALAQGDDSALESTITGNQEQPQVSYIVPWQNPEGPELAVELTSSAAEGVFDHLERDEFQRALKALPELEPKADSAQKAPAQNDE